MKPAAVLLAIAATLVASVGPVSAHHNGYYGGGYYHSYPYNNGWHQALWGTPNGIWGRQRSYWAPPALVTYPPGRRIGWYKHHNWY